jgi:predicted enzyme related to lactoylglutathione lyase
MADAMGQFVWYELMTTDADAAEEFYRSVIGWGVQDASRPEFRYTIFTAGEIPVGGLMDLPDAAREMGAGPGWMGYIAVDDVDARAAMVAEAGGKIHRSPDDIPEVGRFAVVADPQGAAFVLFKSLMDQPRSERRAMVAGASCMPRIGNRLSPSIPACSDGPRPRRWIWGLWGSISFSREVRSRSAA